MFLVFASIKVILGDIGSTLILAIWNTFPYTVFSFSGKAFLITRFDLFFSSCEGSSMAISSLESGMLPSPLEMELSVGWWETQLGGHWRNTQRRGQRVFCWYWCRVLDVGCSRFIFIELVSNLGSVKCNSAHGMWTLEFLFSAASPTQVGTLVHGMCPWAACSVSASIFC